MTTPFCDIIRNNLQSGDIIDLGPGKSKGDERSAGIKTG
jgi:hypothetical protein